MTRNAIWLTALLLVAVTAFAIGTATQSVTAAQSASVSEAATATVGATPTLSPDKLSCFLGDQLWIADPWQPVITPTRIFTPTPLVNGTNTASPVPTRTATATPAACKPYVVTAVTLNVRAGAGTNFAILKTLNKGDIVSLSTLAADSVTVAGVVWRKVCNTGDPVAFVSGSWVQVAP